MYSVRKPPAKPNTPAGLYIYEFECLPAIILFVVVPKDNAFWVWTDDLGHAIQVYNDFLKEEI